MTEQEWLAATHPNPMLSFMWMKGGERKPRLVAAACFRRAISIECEKHLEDPDEQVIDFTERTILAERIAEGLSAAPSERDHRSEFHSSIFPGSSSALEWAAHRIADPSAWEATSGVMIALADEWNDVEAIHGAAVVRDVFGNPFRPVTADPVWLTSDVIALATGIYQDRAFDRLPILADALQDAGCDDADILSHCRSNGPHVRGCWVVDLLLGKE